MGRCRYVEVVYAVLSGEYLRSSLGQSFGAEVLYLSRWDAAVVSLLHYDASRISNRLRWRFQVPGQCLMFGSARLGKLA